MKIKNNEKALERVITEKPIKRLKRKMKELNTNVILELYSYSFCKNRGTSLCHHNDCVDCIFAKETMENVKKYIDEEIVGKYAAIVLPTSDYDSVIFNCEIAEYARSKGIITISFSEGRSGSFKTYFFDIIDLEVDSCNDRKERVEEAINKVKKNNKAIMFTLIDNKIFKKWRIKYFSFFKRDNVAVFALNVEDVEKWAKKDFFIFVREIDIDTEEELLSYKGKYDKIAIIK